MSTAAEAPVIRILTLFPDMVRTVLATSIPGRAAEAGLVRYEVVDIRDFAADRHRTVDDTAYGGGAGMIMMAPPVVEAVEACRGRADATVILTTPQGEVFDEEMTLDLLAELENAGELILVCGHYKGVDERVRELVVTREVSLGDFVLSGGEPAALALIDATVRLLPGVLGAAASLGEESFERGLLEYPHYTRPAEWQGRAVPEVLLSGHHEKIRAWRLAQAEEITRRRRPDLWARYEAARKTARIGEGSER